METLGNTAKLMLVGTLYTAWVSYQEAIIKSLTGNDKLAANHIQERMREIDELQDNMYKKLVHMDADKIDVMKNDVDIQDQVKKAYNIYYRGIYDNTDWVENDRETQINNLDANRIGMWLAQLATDENPNYSFDPVPDNELEEKLNTLGATSANVALLSSDAPVPPMPTNFTEKPYNKIGRRDKDITYHGGKKTKRHFKKSKKDKKSKKAKKTKKGKKMKKTKKSNARKAKKMKKSSRK